MGIQNVTSTSSIDTASQVNYTLTQPTGLAAEILAAGIWTGATDSHWNAFTPGNWLFGAIPINWQNVTFDANTVNGTVNIEWYKGTGAFSLNSGLATDIAFDNGGQPIIQSANNLNGSGSWINIDPDSRNLTINSSYLIWDGSATWNIGTGRALTINGAISSTYGITMTGPGTAVLTGANTYTGTTAVNAGVLNIRNATALGTTAAGTSVTSGAALQIQNHITVGAESLTLNGTGISADGALRNISGNNVWHGTVTLGSSGVLINSDADSLTFNTAANSITGTNTNLTLGGTGNGMVAGTITTGSGTLTKDGNGIWTLSGANTYTGATTVSQGTLALIGGSQASPITVNSGASLGFTLGSPTSSTSTFDLSAGTIKITGTPALASYTLIASSIAITGTPVLDASISGYSLLVEGGTILKLIKSGYASWATDQGLTGTAGDGSGTDPAFDADPNKDGIQNGMAWILGAGALGDPAANLLKLPAVSRDGTGAMILTFDRLGSSDASAPLVVQYSDNLGATPWTDLAVGASGGTDGNITIAVATGGGSTAAGYDRITVTIPATYMAAHPKTFARLMATHTP